MNLDQKYDVIVVGGGHAGIEASLAATRVGVSVAIITMTKQTIGRMSCNPSIGGLAKGQMVREIDALGGAMGSVADKTGTQFKLLNKSKGRAVWSPRAQVDKREYEKNVRYLIKKNKIPIIEGEVVSPVFKKGTLTGVLLASGDTVRCRTTVLTNGTFLNGLIHIGDSKIPAGRMGEVRSEGITEALSSLGLKHGRLKTGTPPRVDKNSINLALLETITGDTDATPFSHFHKTFNPQNTPSYAASTNSDSHNIIWDNINLSPMFSGDILGVGPRYCPSIEDKINRFKERSSHRLICEPEWKKADQIYLNGFSTSLPEQIQLRALRKVRGFEKISLIKPGYAIEYDYFFPNQLKTTLETKPYPGLFLAGQINGTSGYEEAAIQGLVAGANAALSCLGLPPLVLSRSEAYGGVLIDDLITKSTPEPYRMFTSRAENRLILRFTNANERLASKGYKSRLITKKQHETLLNQTKEKQKALLSCEQPITPIEANPVLVGAGEKPLKQQLPLKEIIKRPKVNLISFMPTKINKPNVEDPYINEVALEADTEIKYSGYIKRINAQTKNLLKNDKTPLKTDTKYEKIPGLSSESKEKLGKIKPENLGQAMRLSGVSLADIAVLSVYIEKERRVSRET